MRWGEDFAMISDALFGFDQPLALGWSSGVFSKISVILQCSTSVMRGNAMAASARSNTLVAFATNSVV